WDHRYRHYCRRHEYPSRRHVPRTGCPPPTAAGGRGPRPPGRPHTQPAGESVPPDPEACRPLSRPSSACRSPTWHCHPSRRLGEPGPPIRLAEPSPADQPDAARRGGRGQRRRRQWARQETAPQWARAGRGPGSDAGRGQRPAVAEADAPGALTARTGSRPPRGVTVSSRMFHADLHIHSRFSRACSKNCDAGTLAWWAARKGVTVVGTGDFTHPAWAAELAESLEPAEPGLLRLRPELQAELERTTPASCDPRGPFMLSAEIATIYKRD